MANILVIHGPNLNLLGTREPDVYGADTLADINQSLSQMADEKGVKLQTFQSNAEGDIVNCIQQANANKTHFIIINPAAYTQPHRSSPVERIRPRRIQKAFLPF
jgi:3-dehydroquinate dehydratase-2